MKTPRVKWRLEMVRVARRNGWPVAVIVSERGSNCFTTLVEDKCFGRLKPAREHIVAQVKEKWESHA